MSVPAAGPPRAADAPLPAEMIARIEAELAVGQAHGFADILCGWARELALNEAADLLRRLAAAPAKEPDRETLATALRGTMEVLLNEQWTEDARPTAHQVNDATFRVTDAALAALGRARPEPEDKP